MWLALSILLHSFLHLLSPRSPPSYQHTRRKGEAPEEFVKQLTHVTAAGLALTDMVRRPHPNNKTTSLKVGRRRGGGGEKEEIPVETC